MIALLLLATACGGDDAEFSVDEIWCIGLVDGIEISADVDVTEDALVGTLGDCVANEVPTSSGGFENPALLSAVHAAREAGRPLHLMGLVSDGGVHSHINHLLALIKMCSEHHVQAQLHIITDGQDTPPKSAMRISSSCSSPRS